MTAPSVGHVLLKLLLNAELDWGDSDVVVSDELDPPLPPPAKRFLAIQDVPVFGGTRIVGLCCKVSRGTDDELGWSDRLSQAYGCGRSAADGSLLWTWRLGGGAGLAALLLCQVDRYQCCTLCSEWALGNEGVVEEAAEQVDAVS